MFFFTILKKRFYYFIILFFIDFYFKGLFSVLFFYFFKYDSFQPINTEQLSFYFNYTIKLYLGEFYETSPFYKTYLTSENFMISIDVINNHMIRIRLLPRNLNILWQHSDVTFSYFIECYYFTEKKDFIFFHEIYMSLLKSLDLCFFLDQSNKSLGSMHDLYYYSIHSNYWVSFCRLLILYDTFFFSYFKMDSSIYYHLLMSLKFSSSSIAVNLLFRHIAFYRFFESLLSN